MLLKLFLIHITDSRNRYESPKKVTVKLENVVENKKALAAVSLQVLGRCLRYVVEQNRNVEFLTGFRGVVKTSRFCERRKYRCFCTAQTLKRHLRRVKECALLVKRVLLFLGE